MADYQRTIDIGNLWQTIVAEAQEVADRFPLLADFYRRNILQHSRFENALAYILAEKLNPQNNQSDQSNKRYQNDAIDHNSQIANGCQEGEVEQWQAFLIDQMECHPAIARAARKDLVCQLQSNSCIKDHYTPLLHFGGYQALQCYRFAHYCWNNDMRPLAIYIQGEVVTKFGVDIHPGAVIGEGIFMDHAVGIVIGETAVVEDDVTLFQSVTLGGTGKGSGDRHPKIRKGAFIGSGAVIFGNIEIGERAKIAGGSVIVKPVPADTTAVGNTARIIGTKE